MHSFFDTAFLKEHKESLIPALTKVINQSINESTFPTVLKTAIVKPVFKSGDKLQVSNYRPISILPTISKVLEKVVAEQLMEHLDSLEMLHPLQFGFRKHYSTETACSYFLEDVKSSLDGGGIVGAVFLDLRKAFDTVNHELLLCKLTKFGFHTSTINWIKSYLCDRQQCVIVNNVRSSLRACSLGVPQGSILGPLLFTLYINDLPSVCAAKIIMYADDTVVFAHGRTVEEVAHKLSLEMVAISNWLKNSCLTLNVEKTVAMFFTNRLKPQCLPHVFIEGIKIHNIDQHKYLGVILDSNLNFKKHIKHISNI